MPEASGHSSGQQDADADRAFIHLATVLEGAEPLGADKGVNDTFRGQLLLTDGTIVAAFIKDLDPKQLANELMAAALAHAAALPVPAAYLSVVQTADFPIRKAPCLASGQRLVFGSADARTPPVAQLYLGQDATVQQKVRERLASWPEIGRLYGFDSWIANTDRHERNLLFSGDQVWLIDHGHCFTGPAWTPGHLAPDKAYSNKLQRWLTPVMTEAQRQKSAGAAATVSREAGSLDVAKIGQLNWVANVLDRGDFTALVGFLSQRTPHVPRLAANALGLMG